MKFRSALLGAALFTFSIFAQAAHINFDDPGITNPFGNFYAGDGVIFEDMTWRVIGGFGFVPTSQPSFATFQYESGWMNVLGGFTDSLSFSYGAYGSTTVSIFDGLYGTGTLLGSTVLPAHNPYSLFDSASIAFSGTAYSVFVVAEPLSFGWDDLQFSNGQQEVPVSATLPLFGLGLVALGLSRRQRLLHN